MSNIIKSSRVIERDIVYHGKTSTDQPHIDLDASLYDRLLKEAEKKYDEIIKTAEGRANEIIDSAHEEAEERLNMAYERAKEITKKFRDEGYREGKEQGYKKGYEDGYDEGKKESNKLIKEALSIKDSYVKKRNRLLKEAEKDLVELVISVYEKVLNKKVEEDTDIIVDLILNGIDNLEISQTLTIIVPKESYDSVNKSRDIILAKASLIDELDIRVNSNMKKGDCILETTKGSVDVSVDNQLNEVRDLLNTILNNE